MRTHLHPARFWSFQTLVYAGAGALVGAALLVLSSCQTMGGFGEDVQHAGREIEEAAD